MICAHLKPITDKSAKAGVYSFGTCKHTCMTQVLFMREILNGLDGAGGGEMNRSYSPEKASASSPSSSGTRQGLGLAELYHGICPASYIRFILLFQFILFFQVTTPHLNYKTISISNSNNPAIMSNYDNDNSVSVPNIQSQFFMVPSL